MGIGAREKVSGFSQSLAAAGQPTNSKRTARRHGLGTPELIAANDDEYVRIVSRLIGEEALRAQIRARLAAADLDATIFSNRTADCFREAINYLIANHERLRRDTDRRALRFGQDIRSGSPEM